METITDEELQRARERGVARRLLIFELVGTLAIALTALIASIVECIKSGHHAYFFLFGATTVTFVLDIIVLIQAIKKGRDKQ